MMTVEHHICKGDHIESSLTVNLVKHCQGWPDDWMKRASDSVRLGFAMALASEGTAEVTLVAGDDALLVELNSRYRNKSGPTNVLSFPSGIGAGMSFPEGAEESVYLGDIVLAQETIMREASTWSKKTEDHVVHLAVHGLLHLLGFHHDEAGPATHMESMEKHILHHLGIADPYTASPSGKTIL
ncbi:MAG: rRNA maturation RNase YbeY [Parvularculales bacterium]